MPPRMPNSGNCSRAWAIRPPRLPRSNAQFVCLQNCPKPGANWATSGFSSAMRKAPTTPMRSISLLPSNNPALIEAARALCDNRLAVAERLLARFPQAPSDRRRRDPHAGRGRRAARPLRRRRDAARALPGAGARLRAGAAQLCDRAATARTRPSRRWPRSIGCSQSEPRQSGLSQPEGRGAGPDRRLRREPIAIYESVLEDHPDQPKAWMSYGHALKTVGRQAECIAAYRRSIELLPVARRSLVEPRQPQDLPLHARTRSPRCRRSWRAHDLDDEDRCHLHFALGKALEDAGDYAESFAHYAPGQSPAPRAAALRRRRDHRPRAPLERFVHAGISSPRAAAAALPARDPIFIVGLPRSGSTLVEQILASHSQVEGTMELPDIIAIARRLGGRRDASDASAYPEMLADLDARRGCARSGEEYLERTRIQRKTRRGRSSSTRCRTTSPTSA